MSKGLEALEELRFQVGNITYHTHDLQITTIKVRDSGLFEIIGKELKALEKIVELIKKMGYNLENLGNGCFCFSIDCFVSINEQTFNLLKEVLL